MRSSWNIQNCRFETSDGVYKDFSDTFKRVDEKEAREIHGAQKGSGETREGILYT
jgi:hypothetical protein